MKNLLRQYRLTAFIGITFLSSWICWLTIFNELKPSLFEFDSGTLLVFLLGAYAPSLVALALSFYLDGAAGVKVLLRRLLMWRVGWSWNFLALLAGPCIYVAAILLYANTGGFLGSINYGMLPWIPVVLVVSLFLGPLAEELGWRGYVLSYLDTNAKPVRSALIMGLIWGAWHIPLFWAVIGTSVSGFPVTPNSVSLFFLSTIGTSFLYLWMHNATAGSLWIAVLIHLGWNASGNIVSLLFPQMSAVQKLDFYVYPIALVWVVLGLAAVVKLSHSKFSAIKLAPSAR